MKTVAGLLLLLTVVATFLNSAIADEAQKAPETYKVLFETSGGDFVVEVHREWSPNGADRFHKLIESGFYDDCRFFRVVPGFMVQWGINGDPEIQKNWVDATIKDDRVVKSNKRGFMTYAKIGRPNSRTSQVFINYDDNSRLDADGFAPFGEIIEGMDVVDAINSKYGERPDQGQIQKHGNVYLNKSFPKLDYIRKASVVKEEAEKEEKAIDTEAKSKAK